MNKNTKILIAALAILSAAGGGTLVWRNIHSGHGMGAKTGILYYYCPMHPNIQKDRPGSCPICSMDLVPGKKKASSSATTGERKIRYWVDSMNPKFRSDKPGKAPDGMDLVPVYDDETTSASETTETLKGLVPVTLTAYKQQLIGVKLVNASKQVLTRTIATVGRKADLGGAYVADVYALDIAFVKEGQKAWISSFNGSSPRTEGAVAGLFPFDDTQSRIRRVRIVSKGNVSGPYANVRIEADTPPRLAVPADAVMDTGTHTYVFVQTEPGHFVPKEVAVGTKGDTWWEIVGGLKEGERVVSGANFLVDADSRLSAILQN